MCIVHVRWNVERSCALVNVSTFTRSVPRSTLRLPSCTLCRYRQPLPPSIYSTPMVLPSVYTTNLQPSRMNQLHSDYTMLTTQTIYNFVSARHDPQGTKRTCDGISLNERPAKRLQAQGGVSIDLIVNLQAMPLVNAQPPGRPKRSTKGAKGPDSFPTKKARAKSTTVMEGTRRSTRLSKAKAAGSEAKNTTENEIAATASDPLEQRILISDIPIALCLPRRSL